MAIEINAEASRRFIDALEAFRTQPGDGLRTDVREPAPQALVDQFQKLMDAPAGANMVPPGAEVVFVPEHLNTPAAKGIAPDAVSGVQPMEATNPVSQTSDLATDAPKGVNGTNGVGSTQQIKEMTRVDIPNVMNPTDLIGLQFEHGVSVFELRSLVGTRQSFANDLQQTLKQSS